METWRHAYLQVQLSYFDLMNKKQNIIHIFYHFTPTNTQMLLRCIIIVFVSYFYKYTFIKDSSRTDHKGNVNLLHLIWVESNSPVLLYSLITMLFSHFSGFFYKETSITLNLGRIYSLLPTIVVLFFHFFRFFNNVRIAFVNYS